MHTLLKIQLKKIYGKNFSIDNHDEQFNKLLELVEGAYENYESEQKLIDNILATNSKELEDVNYRLFEKTELLNSVKNSMDDVVFYKNLNHQYMGCNKKFQEFLGLSEQEIIGKSDYDFFDKEIADRYYNTNEQIIKDRVKVVYKQWVEFKKEKVYTQVSKTALVNSKSEVIGIVGIARDITNEFEMQQDIEHKNIMLIQQNKLVSMGEMIANIAHQWRQPLNALGIIVQKMGIFYKRGILDDKQLDENISTAMLLMEEMSETIDDFRNFFSNERVLENFNVKKAFLKSYKIVKPLLDENNIKLTLNIEETCTIYGYKNEFFQVILNLLNNAIEALIRDKIAVPKIDINIKHNNKNIVLDICDNANGISNSIINKIFDPYFTTKETGTGLGLYMSKIIIEEHMGGEISFQNSILGTNFRIKLKKKVLN